MTPAAIFGRLRNSPRLRPVLIVCAWYIWAALFAWFAFFSAEPLSFVWAIVVVWSCLGLIYSIMRMGRLRWTMVPLFIVFLFYPLRQLLLVVWLALAYSLR